MKLRCIEDRHTPFKRGRYYDVAEILELPEHVMVRKADGRWPKPGDLFFNWHANEFFACPSGGIPAYSCGYEYVELDWFGAIVSGPTFLARRSSGGNLWPSTALSKRIKKVVDACGGETLSLWTFRDVVPTSSLPAELGSNFVLIGAPHWKLGRKASYKSAEKMIRKVLVALKIPASKMPVIEDQELEFWKRKWRDAGPWTWPRWTSRSL